MIYCRKCAFGNRGSVDTCRSCGAALVTSAPAAYLLAPVNETSVHPVVVGDAREEPTISHYTVLPRQKQHEPISPPRLEIPTPAAPEPAAPPTRDRAVAPPAEPSQQCPNPACQRINPLALRFCKRCGTTLTGVPWIPS